MSLSGFLLFLVIACGVYRLAELAVFDNAPFNLLERLRVWTGLHNYDQQGNKFFGSNAFQKWLGGVLDCPFCAGVYPAFVGAGVWLALMALCEQLLDSSPLTLVLLFLVVWLGLAGLQSFMESGWGRVNLR